jgi:putative transposase
MIHAYSLDLREKVMAFIASGSSKREAAKVFNIGEDTIYRWLRRQKAGNLAPKKRTDFPRKVDLKKLRFYVASHPDHTLTEIAKALGLGVCTVFKWLNRLGITRKKRLFATKKEMKRKGLSLKRN